MPIIESIYVFIYGIHVSSWNGGGNFWAWEGSMHQSSSSGLTQRLKSWFADDTATGEIKICSGEAAAASVSLFLYKPCPPPTKSFPPLPTATLLPSTRRLLKSPTVRITRECAFQWLGGSGSYYGYGWQRSLTRSSSFALKVPRLWIFALLVMMPLLKPPRVSTPRATSPRVSCDGGV